jgi:type VI secretion system secreted protein Hcp
LFSPKFLASSFGSPLNKLDAIIKARGGLVLPTQLQRKYILASILLLGAMSGVVLAFWNSSSFVEADTPKNNTSILNPAVDMFLKIEGEITGDIQGDVTEAGKEGWIECISYQHSVVSPRDAASGLPTGKRQHKPFTITKAIDKASPLLYKVLIDNENLLYVDLYFYEDTEHYFTIRLEDAHIASMQTFIPPDPLDTVASGERPIEQVTFVYGKIIWTHEVASIESSDSWADVDK